MQDPHVSDPKSGKVRVAKLEDPAPCFVGDAEIGS
jgi:hypothetical protein